MKKYLLLALTLSAFLSQPAAAGPIQNEIIILLDSSGSVYDPGYNTWFSMLDAAEQIVNQTESANTAHGVGIFSGGSSSSTLQSVANAGRMNMHWGLSGGSLDPYTGDPIPTSQNPGDVAGFIAGLDETDFTGGFSWHDEALEMALQSFLNSSNGSGTNKYVFMLTDLGGPNSGHEAVDPVSGYESATVQSLRSMDVTISAIYFENFVGLEIDYFNALVSDPALLIDGAGFGGFDITSIVTNSSSSVPEPETLPMIALGLLGLLLYRRRICDI